MQNPYKAGVYISGSHITAGLVDTVSGNIVKNAVVRERINSSGSADDILTTWTNAIKKLKLVNSCKIEHVGIGMPGPFDYDRGISFMKDQGKYDSLYGINIKASLEKALGFKSGSIKFMNDAACFLKGELDSGSIQGSESVIGLTLGTGLGSAYYLNEKIADSKLWKMSFLDGIAEDYISTRWFVKRYKELTGSKIRSVTELASLKETDLVSSIFEEFSENLAEVLYIFIQRKRPFTVILGGSIMNADTFFLRKVRFHLYKKMGYSLPISKSAQGEIAALLGAASLDVS